MSYFVFDYEIRLQPIRKEVNSVVGYLARLYRNDVPFLFTENKVGLDLTKSLLEKVIEYFVNNNLSEKLYVDVYTDKIDNVFCDFLLQLISKFPNFDFNNLYLQFSLSEHSKFNLNYFNSVKSSQINLVYRLTDLSLTNKYLYYDWDFFALQYDNHFSTKKYDILFGSIIRLSQSLDTDIIIYGIDNESIYDFCAKSGVHFYSGLYHNNIINISKLVLTDLQQELMPYLKQGLTDKKIALALHLSPSTINKRISSILAANNLENRTQLARRLQ